MIAINRELDKLFNIFTDLVEQYGKLGEYGDISQRLKKEEDDNELPNEEEKIDEAINTSLKKQAIVRRDLCAYLKAGIPQIVMKENMVWYIFLTNFVFTKYNPQLQDEFVAKYEFLNDVYNECSPEEIIALLYKHDTLLLDLIEQYTLIDFMINEADPKVKEELNQVVQFYMSQNPAQASIQIMLLPQIFQNIAMDLEIMYNIEAASESDTAIDIYRYLFVDPEELPDIFGIDPKTIEQNRDVLIDELTLYTLIYLTVKKENLGLTTYEMDLLDYIMAYLNNEDINYEVDGDAQYMVSQYLHVLTNRDFLLEKHPKEVEKALTLARKKINCLSISCFDK
jgi:hypothetical protein